MAPSSSSGPKAGLKAAKLAIDQKKFQDAIGYAEDVLRVDSKNYLALVFLGHSYDKLKQRQKSEEAYQKATVIKPEDDKAWLGLRALFEREVSVSELVQVSLQLAKIYLEQGDQHKCQGAVDRAVTFSQQRGTKEQYRSALELQLPDGPFYSFLEGRLPPPGHTYLRLTEITEELETSKINHDIGEQRTRLGARKADVTINVKRSVYGSSKLEEYYQGIIDWTSNDEQRREYEEKKLMRSYDHLVVAKQEEKELLREHVVKMAHGMVIIKHPLELAWDLELEWQDVENVVQLDVSVIRDYITFFPDKGLSKVLKGYLASDQSPFPEPPSSPHDSDDEAGGVALETVEDKILNMNDGLLEAKDSLLAHRIMGEFYLQLEEYEPAVETIRRGFTICTEQKKRSGLKFSKTLDAMNTTLGTALIKYQSPRNHPEAKIIFENILKRRPTFTPALLGTGLILEEEEDFSAALDYLTKALKRDPKNLTISAEAAWCNALNGNWSQGLQELQSSLRKLDSSKENENKRSKELRSQILYRIGRCQWEVDPSRVGRKDRKHGPYASFLESVKTDPNYAPAYTSLGIYYEDYARDKRRARQCFQRAFDLSPSEVLAAEKLARSFADLGEWEVVEVIAQRVIDSGKTRPPPPVSGGKKKKGISWPYSALGVVQMNRQDYQNSIVSFLAALRLNPGDYHSYVGLGESYHNSGRYNSALRTFTYAETPEDGLVMVKGTSSNEDWFTKYMLANVRRELGDHEDAIEAYETVLEERPEEFGVQIALLQTLLEKASTCLETGFFGRAIESATQSFDVAITISKQKPEAFNLWKSVADACLVFATVQERIKGFPTSKVAELLKRDFDTNIYDSAAANVEDGFGKDKLDDMSTSARQADISDNEKIVFALSAAILAQKRALHCVTNDTHAQAVAWYNLGWTQQKAHFIQERRNQLYHHSGIKSKGGTKILLRAAVKCFKRAIELEPGNADFWNALGTTTSTLNDRVSQHSFVRSLHVDDLRNPSAWTNLGALALLKNDVELAHDAFARGQSADPDFAGAWTGEGIVAMLLGDKREGWAHFEHAVGISQSDFAPAKEEHAKGAFDGLLVRQDVSNSAAMIQPVLLALEQLTALKGPEPALEHVTALFRERAGDYETATNLLEEVCAGLEVEYEETEDEKTLIRFAQAKADLARNLLATKEFIKAAEEADTALSLTEDEPDSTRSKDDLSLRNKIRLSARLTVGLAKFYLDDMDEALSAFKMTLQETNSAPDVICSLAQVLWAKGGKRERKVAKERLFEAFTSSQDGPDATNVGPVLMLGAMAVLESPPDMDTAEAVREELEGIRIRDGFSKETQDNVRIVLAMLVDLLLSGNSQELRYEAQKAVMLFPSSPGSWTRFADVVSGTRQVQKEVDDQALADMALQLSTRQVAPRGNVTAEQLSEAFARTGRIIDAQRAVMVNPGGQKGWRALSDGVKVLIGPDSPGGIPLR